jgi:molybdopterin/thiamine biosynthesis adenylyltransferase
VIKEIVGVGEGLVGRLLLYDARDTRFDTIEYRWNPANPLNGRARS